MFSQKWATLIRWLWAFQSKMPGHSWLKKQISHKTNTLGYCPLQATTAWEEMTASTQHFNRESRHKSWVTRECDKSMGWLLWVVGKLKTREECHGAPSRNTPRARQAQEVGAERSPVITYPYQCWCLAQKLQKIALPQTSPPCRMAQVLDSDPEASSALDQPDEEHNTGPHVWCEACLSLDPWPYTHDVSFTNLQCGKSILHGKDTNKWTNTPSYPRYIHYRQGSGALCFVSSLFLFLSNKQKKRGHPKTAIKNAFSATSLSF